MVVALLLADPNTPVRYGELGRTALQCLHAIHSMEQALAIFHSACMYSNFDGPTASPKSSPSQLLAAFDAHVADCACQTRVLMLLELVKLYSLPDNTEILRRAVSLLKELKVNAIVLWEEIEMSRKKQRNSKLSDLTTHLAIWERIQFTSFLDLADDSSRRNVPVSGATLPAPESESLAQSSHNIMSDRHWDPRNFLVVVRFLTISYLLSGCKVATPETGPPTRMNVRLDLRSMYEKNSQELEDLQLTTQKLSYCNKSHTVTSQMKRQGRAMQSYISMVTTDWVRQAASPQNCWPSFPEGFIASNDRHLSCVSSYVSMLLVRAQWVKLDIPILVVIQRFCSRGGYHHIYYRVVKNPAAEISSKELLHGIGNDGWFEKEVVSLDQVISSPWARTPHIILIGMSGQGTINNFRSCLLASLQGHWLQQDHGPDRCCETDKCIRQIEAANFPRVLSHCFAQHEQFPFRLPAHEDGFDRVAALLRSSLGEEAEEAFTKVRLGAEQYGTGKSTRLWTIEHFFLEFPSVLGRSISDQGEAPQVFGCKLKLPEP